MASHVLHHLLKISATSSSTLTLCIAVILVLPLAEVHLQPVLFGLLSQEPFPVGSLLSLFQSKLNAPRSHLVLGRLRVHLLQKLHVKLKSCFFSAPSAPEDQRVLLHLNFWILNVRNVDGEEDNLWPLSP